MTALDFESLPFLPGNNTIVQRMADIHELITFSAPNNWKELLAAGDRALALAGREVASAKSSAEAATANLRWKTYEERQNAAHAALLGVAHSQLQTRPKFDASVGLVIGLLGFGRDIVGSPLKVIPQSHWEAGSVDWAARTLAVVDGTRWHGVRILDLADVDIETAIQLLGEPNGEGTAQPKGMQSPAEGINSGAFARADDIRSATTNATRGSPKRPRGRSLAGADDKFVDEMHQMFSSGEEPSPTRAAWRIIGLDGSRAKGAGSPESKVSRLVKRYKERYGE